MANSDNKLSGVKFKHIDSLDFEKVLAMQAQLQKRFGTNFEYMSLYDVANFLMKNKHAMEDEYGEMLDAVGGIDDGIRSAAWKWWKLENISTAQNRTIEDLSENDRLELKYEVVDIFHFFLNILLATKMTGSELFSMYIAKNIQNHIRKDEGY